MATYFMFGRYSVEARGAITPARTQRARETVQALGGDIVTIYALLGEIDLVIILELPGTEAALQASVALSRLTGVTFSTYPAFSAEQLDALMNHP